MTIVVISGPNLVSPELCADDGPHSDEELTEPALWIGNGSLRVPRRHRPTDGIHEAPSRGSELVVGEVAT